MYKGLTWKGCRDASLFLFTFFNKLFCFINSHIKLWLLYSIAYNNLNKIRKENGLSKLTNSNEFTVINRGGKGTKCHTITEKTGELVSVLQVNQDVLDTYLDKVIVGELINKERKIDIYLK